MNSIFSLISQFQSLLLASSIIKFIWSSGSTYNNLLDEAQTHSKMMKMKPPVITSGSDNSGLGDAENSDVCFRVVKIAQKCDIFLN